MNPTETNRVSNIGRNDPEALANVVGMEDLDTSPQANDRQPSKLARIGLVGAVAGTAMWLLAPRGEDTPDPVPPTYDELAQQSAELPYNPAEDTLVIDGIKVAPGNPNKNTPSEAVLNNKEVNQYRADNPDESASLIASATSLDDHAEYAVVERDIDGDGDNDAVAVPASPRQ